MKNYISFIILITISLGLQAQDKKKNPRKPPPNSFDPSPDYSNKSSKTKRVPKISFTKTKSQSSKKRGFEWQLNQKKKEFNKRMVANGSVASRYLYS